MRAVEAEPDRSRRLSKCEGARHAMQDRLIEISGSNGLCSSDPEQLELEEALRKLWVLEQSLRKQS